ncbi:MAG: 4Fe-4S dicluster domain-containing protein [Candidatus Thorarchaeota archaeon]
MPTSRRNFLKLLGAIGAVGGTLAITSKLNFNQQSLGRQNSATEEEFPPQWVMMIDLEKCDGCQDKDISSCLEACAIMHYVPKRFKESGEPTEPSEPQAWIELYEKEDNSLAGKYFLPRPCMHCESPPCLWVCPTGATFRNDEGLVLIDHRICIGCRMCIAACPYNARYFNWGEPEPWFGTREEEIEYAKQLGAYSAEYPLPHQRGVVEKCDFCSHSAKNGQLPACVGACPGGALYFGNLNHDLVTNGTFQTVPLSDTVKERMGYRLQEELGTKPRIFYLPKR